jgi:ABC-type multidrug transport system ATPase subunit
MPKQFSSALRKSEFDSRNARILSLVEPTRDQGKVALRVEALSKRYGEIEAVADVSFEVSKGEIFGLLGVNGAGKSTLISILATERRPSSGDALVLGHSVRDERQAVRQLIGVAPQELALYPMLTAAEIFVSSAASTASGERSSRAMSSNCSSWLDSRSAGTIAS